MQYIQIVDKEKRSYILILEGTFSDDMTTTGTSFQDDPWSGSKQCMSKEERMGNQKGKG